MSDKPKAQSVRLVFYSGRNGDGDVLVEYLLHSNEYVTPIIEATRDLPEDEPFEPGEWVELPSRSEWHVSAPAFALFMPPSGEIASLRAATERYRTALERIADDGVEGYESPQKRIALAALGREQA